MKKFCLLAGLLLAITSLTGCDSSNSGDTDKDKDKEKEEEATIYTSWQDDLAKGMKTYLKAELPVPSIDKNISYSYVVDQSTGNINISFNTAEDFISQYISSLTSSGYYIKTNKTSAKAYGCSLDEKFNITSVEETLTNYYYWELVNESNYLYLSVSSKALADKTEDGEYYLVCTAGNSIQAYANANDGYTYSAWPSKKVIDFAGSDIPHPEDGKLYIVYNFVQFLRIHAFGSSVTTEGYTSILTSQGWTVTYDEKSESYNCENLAYDYLIFFYDEPDDDEFVIGVYLLDEEVKEWPTELKEGMKQELGEELPYYDVDTKYEYVVDSEYEYIDIIYDTQLDLMSDYADLLVENGYEIVTDKTTYTGYGYTVDESGNLTGVDETETEYDYWALTKGDIVVILTVSSKALIYDGGDGYYYLACEAGNEIYAYLDSEEPGSGEEVYTEWPTNEITAIFGEDIPHFEGESYSLVDWSIFGLVYLYVDGVSETSESEYKTILENDGWTVSYDSDYAVYMATKEGCSIEVDFSYFDGSLLIELFFASSQESDEWPTELIESYFGEDILIPQYPSFISITTDYSDIETYGFCIFLEVEEDNAADIYTDVLEGYGYTVKYDYLMEWFVGTDENEIVDVCFYYEDGYLSIQIFEHTGTGEETSEGITFDSEMYLVSKDGEESVWQNGDYTFTVTKGTASIDVGNGNYFSSPLRMYAGHHGEITWGEQEVSQIIITTSSASNKASACTAVDFVGGTASVEGDIITIDVDENAESVSFDVSAVDGKKQLHVVSITFVA